ncbi:MAG: hypothetical protein ACMZ7B_01085 [Balneola sp.]
MNTLYTILSEISSQPERADRWEASFSYTILISAIITLIILQL